MKHLEEELRRIGEELKEQYKGELQSKGKIASGTLYNSVEYELRWEGGDLKLYFKMADHWINVEEGRQVGKKQPPLLSLLPWMVKRGIEPLKETAFVIARSISRKGIKGVPIVRDIKRSLKGRFQNRLEEVIKREIKEQLKEALGKQLKRT